MLQLPQGNAICCSGYRHGQSPDSRCDPTLEPIREDLHILRKHGQLLRLYDCSVHAELAGQELQAIDHQDLMDGTRQAGLLCFVFDAFDEPWKASSDPLEPQKHWGLFTVDRRPKLVMRELYPELALPEPA